MTRILGTGTNLTIDTLARFLDATGGELRLGLAARLAKASVDRVAVARRVAR